MGATTGISWTDATWSPMRGCSRVSRAVLSNSRRALAVGLRLQAERDEAIRLGLQVIPWAPVVAGRFAEG